jgi:hypothetical protein
MEVVIGAFVGVLGICLTGEYVFQAANIDVVGYVIALLNAAVCIIGVGWGDLWFHAHLVRLLFVATRGSLKRGILTSWHALLTFHMSYFIPLFIMFDFNDMFVMAWDILDKKTNESRVAILFLFFGLRVVWFGICIYTQIITVSWATSLVKCVFILSWLIQIKLFVDLFLNF